MFRVTQTEYSWKVCTSARISLYRVFEASRRVGYYVPRESVPFHSSYRHSGWRSQLPAYRNGRDPSSTWAAVLIARNIVTPSVDRVFETLYNASAAWFISFMELYDSWAGQFTTVRRPLRTFLSIAKPRSFIVRHSAPLTPDYLLPGSVKITGVSVD